MNLGIEVTLPRGETPRFPDRCVVCRRPSPRGTTRLLTATIGRGWGPFIRPGGFFTVEVPACRSCGWRLQARRGLGLVLTIAVGVLAAIFLGPHLAELDKGVRRVILLLGFGVVLAPLIIWEVLAPFSVTAWKEKVDYEFRDDATAYEFAKLNDVHWTESLGRPGHQDP